MFYPLGKPSGFPAVSVWNVRHSSNSCCHLLIGVFAVLAMFAIFVIEMEKQEALRCNSFTVFSNKWEFFLI